MEKINKKEIKMVEENSKLIDIKEVDFMDNNPSIKSLRFDWNRAPKDTDLTLEDLNVNTFDDIKTGCWFVIDLGPTTYQSILTNRKNILIKIPEITTTDNSGDVYLANALHMTTGKLTYVEEDAKVLVLSVDIKGSVLRRKTKIDT
jgi:hypothetical protein